MNEKETGKSSADIAGDIRVIEADISHIKGDISDLKAGMKSQGEAIAELQQGQVEIKTMIKEILATLPEKVEKQGRRISWLFGIVAGLSFMITIVAAFLRV